VADTVPQAPVVLVHDSVQVTPACAGSLKTVAVSGTEPLTTRPAVAGVTYTETCPGVVTTIVAEATAVESVIAAAVRNTIGVTGWTAGAV
jgi:hypothetical protein